jgi:hypothetical protein
MQRRLACFVHRKFKQLGSTEARYELTPETRTLEYATICYLLTFDEQQVNELGAKTG